MLRFLARVALMTITFAVLLVFVRGIGAQVKNPLTEMFTETTHPDGQRQTCWQGICPGLTTIDEAQAILDGLPSFKRDYGTAEDCWRTSIAVSRVCVNTTTNVVSQIELYMEKGQGASTGPPLHLGDLLNLWQEPLVIGQNFCGFSSLVFRDNTYVVFSWQYYFKLKGDSVWTLDPVLPEIPMIYIGESTVKQNLAGMTSWRGFTMFKGHMNCPRG